MRLRQSNNSPTPTDLDRVSAWGLLKSLESVYMEYVDSMEEDRKTSSPVAQKAYEETRAKLVKGFELDSTKPPLTGKKAQLEMAKKARQKLVERGRT